jgi:hypothetical protein
MKVDVCLSCEVTVLVSRDDLQVQAEKFMPGTVMLARTSIHSAQGAATAVHQVVWNVG